MTALAPLIKVYNLARMTTATVGTGPITLGGAATVNGVLYLSFAASGVQDGDVVYYGIQDASASEEGYGTYTAAGTTLTRNVIASTNANTAISLSGSANVFISPASNQFTDPTNITSVNTGQLAGFRNALINGAMMVAQRGTSFTSTGSANNNASYTLDRWKLFSGASAANVNNVVNVTQETSTVPTNGLDALAMTVVTNTAKFAICQFIEQKNCIGLIGNTVTLSFTAKVSSAAAGHITNVKAAIMSWAGTADAPTQPFVSTGWATSGTTPTAATSWTFNNTPANLSLTTSYVTYSITATLNTASTTNIAVIIWSDAFNTTANDVLYVADVQLEIGSRATPFERRSYSAELQLCQRYCWRITGNVTASVTVGSGFASSSTGLSRVARPHPVVMFSATPTVTSSDMVVYSPASGVVTGTVATNNSNATIFDLEVTASGMTTGQGGAFLTNTATTSFLQTAAEM